MSFFPPTGDRRAGRIDGRIPRGPCVPCVAATRVPFPGPWPAPVARPFAAEKWSISGHGKESGRQTQRFAPCVRPRAFLHTRPTRRTPSKIDTRGYCAVVVAGGTRHAPRFGSHSISFHETLIIKVIIIIRITITIVATNRSRFPAACKTDDSKSGAFTSTSKSPYRRLGEKTHTHTLVDKTVGLITINIVRCAWRRRRRRYGRRVWKSASSARKNPPNGRGNALAFTMWLACWSARSGRRWLPDIRSLRTMSDHSSLVATFREKLRPRYGKSGSAANSRYIKENIYFNGIALKESLLYDNECAETQLPKRVLLNNNRTYSNNNKCFEIEKGCFIYQNPTTYCDDNDFVHKFTDMSLINEYGGAANSNYFHTLDTETHKLVNHCNALF